MTFRCFLSPEALSRGSVHLRDAQARHLSRVLRAQRGDPVVCFDGRGRQAEGRIREIRPREVVLELGCPLEAQAPACPIRLGVSVPGEGKLAQIVSQATQMGVDEIVPLGTRRTVIRLSEQRALRKQERLTRVALEACCQSGAVRLPEIRPLTGWTDFLPRLRAGAGLKLIAAVEGPHEKLNDLLAKPPEELFLLIGPEGDWTPQELAEARAAGARPFSLGETVLRVETAVVAALGAVQVLLRESR